MNRILCACLILYSVREVFPTERVPLFKKIFNTGTLSEKLFVGTVEKLNRFAAYEFHEAYKIDNTWAYYSEKNRTSCWLKRYDTDELADLLANEIAEFEQPVFRYANWVGYCGLGNTEDLATKARYILIGVGEWKE